jgi:hypothetical protein
LEELKLMIFLINPEFSGFDAFSQNLNEAHKRKMCTAEVLEMS